MRVCTPQFYHQGYTLRKKGYRNSTPGVLLLQIAPFFQRGAFFFKEYIPSRQNPNTPLSMGCQNNTLRSAMESPLSSSCLNQIDHLMTCHPMSLCWSIPFFLSVCHDMSWQIMNWLPLIQRGWFRTVYSYSVTIHLMLSAKCHLYVWRVCTFEMLRSDSAWHLTSNSQHNFRQGSSIWSM